MSSEELHRALAEIPAIDSAVLNTTGSGIYGLGDAAYVAKPYARLVAEGLGHARALMGQEVDAGQGSVIRKIIEMTSIEHARTYALLGQVLDNLTVPTATGVGLDRLGEELGLPRPFSNAKGSITLQLLGALPSGVSELLIPSGARMLSPGGHHATLTQSARLTAENRIMTLEAEAFYPGPELNLDPTQPSQKLVLWNPADEAIEQIAAVARSRPPGTTFEQVTSIAHTQPFLGGETRWNDERYRWLLLRAPRSLWTARAIELAVGRVPGVREVKVIDKYGGLDVDMSIFGNFNFAERVFGSERDLVTPYLFTILVAPTPAAIWTGPDGLAAQISMVIEDIRPIGIFPEIREAQEIYVGVRANIVVRGLPLPSGDRATVNASPTAIAFKQRLIERCRAYVDRLEFGEPVSPAKLNWALMGEPGVVDVRNLHLVRYPQPPQLVDFSAGAPAGIEVLGCGDALQPGGDQIAQFIDDPAMLTII